MASKTARSRHILFVIALLTATSHGQTVFSVPSTQYPTIQSAINAAMPGDVVGVGPGTYAENIDFLGKAISVLGSGMGVSIIDGNQSGSVVVCDNNEMGAVLDGFTLTNGTGTPRSLPFGPAFLHGGGVSVWGPGFNQLPLRMDVTIRNCEITNCSATNGGGLGVDNFGGLTVEKCIVSNNDSDDGGGGYGFAAYVAVRSCRVFGNTSATYGGGVVVGGAPLAPPFAPPNEVSDCLIENNTVTAGGPAFSFRGGGGIGVSGTILIERCIVRNNVVVQGVVTSDLGWGGGISAGVVRIGSGHISIDNSIVWGNTPDIVTLGPQLATIVINDTLIQPGYTGPGSNDFTTDPKFVDPASGDFRIRGDSKCVGRGDATHPHLGTADFEGQPRILYGALDLGCDEMGDASGDPAAAGNVGTSQGTLAPEQVPFVAGRTGGRARRVRTAVGVPFRIAVRRPSASAGPARFAIYGLREALHSDVLAFPAGIGAMTFPPCILLPSQQPTLFTLTNNFPVGACGQLLSSTLAPWISPAVTIPIAFTFTLQGLIEETAGVVRATNAVIVEVR